MENQNRNNETNNSKQIILSVLAVAILIVAVVGVSFAAFTFAGQGAVQNTISTGTISMTFSEAVNGISITNAMPMSDATGMVQAGTNETFEFTVSAAITGNATINYEVAAIKDISSTLADSQVRLHLERNGTAVAPPAAFTPRATASAIGSPAGSMLLDSGTFTTSGTNNYVLRMWVAEGTVLDATARSFTVRVNVYGQAA